MQLHSVRDVSPVRILGEVLSNVLKLSPDSLCGYLSLQFFTLGVVSTEVLSEKLDLGVSVGKKAKLFLPLVNPGVVGQFSHSFLSG